MFIEMITYLHNAFAKDKILALSKSKAFTDNYSVAQMEQYFH